MAQLVEKTFLGFMGVKERPDPGMKSKVQVPNEMWNLYCRWSDRNQKHPLKDEVDRIRLVEQQSSYFNRSQIQKY